MGGCEANAIRESQADEPDHRERRGRADPGRGIDIGRRWSGSLQLIAYLPALRAGPVARWPCRTVRRRAEPRRQPVGMSTTVASATAFRRILLYPASVWVEERERTHW